MTKAGEAVRKSLEELSKEELVLLQLGAYEVLAKVAGHELSVLEGDDRRQCYELTQKINQRAEQIKAELVEKVRQEHIRRTFGVDDAQN